MFQCYVYIRKGKLRINNFNKVGKYSFPNKYAANNNKGLENFVVTVIGIFYCF